MPNLPVLVLAFANNHTEENQKLAALRREHNEVRAILEKAEKDGLCELMVFPFATPDQVIEALQNRDIRDRIALFHFSGHASSYKLMLESEYGADQEVDGKAFAHFLRHAKGLKLVFLNACSTEAQVKAMQDTYQVPLVIGTTERVKDDIARRISVAFFKGLAQGLSFEDAWADAEQTIFKDHPPSENYRGIVIGDSDGRKPWELYVRKGSEIVKRDTLPGLAGQPLFNLPIPSDYYNRLPDNPFLSIHRFEEKHAPVFFGRGRDIRELYQLVTGDCPIILFHGQSGVGKSSLLVAGLLPRIKGSWCVEAVRRSADSGLKGSLSFALARYGQSPELSLREQWLAIETKLGKPLLIILDQAEEAFTKPLPDGYEKEWTDLLSELNQLFDGPGADTQKGKLILSFRKEYLSEIKKYIEGFEINRKELFLDKLTREGILEAIEGLTKHPDTQREYRLQIEPGLPALIADDLLDDAQSALSPVLQILLTRLWSEGRNRHFTRQRYLEIKKSGIYLRDFFRQELQGLTEAGFGEAVANGLVLNLLSDHTTPMGTANAKKEAVLFQRYPQQMEILPQLLQALVDRYLLDRFENEEGETCYSLCHDTLASVVLSDYHESDRVGQRARRILESKQQDIAQDSASFQDPNDIAILEAGRPYMRAWTTEEEAALEKSKAALAAQRLREAAMKQSNFDFAKTRIEQAILHLDYDFAFRETQKALDLNYEQHQLARLLEEIAFVFQASGQQELCMEALQVLTGLGLPQYAPLAAVMPSVVFRPSCHPLLDVLQQIPDGAAALIKTRYLPEMIFVEGGSFMMGSEENDNEKPIHQVTLDGFYLQKTPVTYWQYFLFILQEGLQVEKPGWGRQGDNPAVYVSWEDAVLFCNWLSIKNELDVFYYDIGQKTIVAYPASNGYRMPTDAEWEYAACGGKMQKTYTFSGSDDLDEVGWYCESAGNRTKPVGLKKSNSLGFYDMSGNIFERCQNLHEVDYQEIGPIKNDKGPYFINEHFGRGGSWKYGPLECSVNYREYFTSSNRLNILGLRLARSR